VAKVLLDSCVWGPVAEALREDGHDVTWAGDWGEDPGDREILRRAHHERAILVTLDKDFGELAVVQGEPHSGIIRLVGFSAREQAAACAQLLDLYATELAEGSLITADPLRVRIRPGEVE
jgi:predicted nuclease of predicted toxin-antitoxin system